MRAAILVLILLLMAGFVSASAYVPTIIIAGHEGPHTGNLTITANFSDKIGLALCQYRIDEEVKGTFKATNGWTKITSCQAKGKLLKNAYAEIKIGQKGCRKSCKITVRAISATTWSSTAFLNLTKA